MKNTLPETVFGWFLVIAIVAGLIIAIAKARSSAGQSSVWINILATLTVPTTFILIYFGWKSVVGIVAPRLFTTTVPSIIVGLCILAIAFLWTRALCGGRQIEVGYVGVWMAFGKIMPVPPISNGPVGYFGEVEELPAPDVVHEFKIRANGSDNTGISVVLIVPEVPGVSRGGQIPAKVKIALRYKVENPKLLLPQLQLKKNEAVDWEVKHRDVAANLVVAYVLDLSRGIMATTNYTAAQARDFEFALGQDLAQRATSYGLTIDDLVITDVALDESFAKSLAELADEGVERQTEQSDLTTVMDLARQAMQAGRGPDGNGPLVFDGVEALLTSMLGREGVNQNTIALALAGYGALKNFSNKLGGGR